MSSIKKYEKPDGFIPSNEYIDVIKNTNNLHRFCDIQHRRSSLVRETIKRTCQRNMVCARWACPQTRVN